MACKMKCKLKGDDPKKTVDKLMEMARDQGLTFDGSTTKGTFEYKGKITAKGEYKRSGKTLTITVTKHPFFIPCSMIVSEMNKMLTNYLSCKQAE